MNLRGDVMKEEKGIFDYIVFIILILSIILFICTTSFNYNTNLMFLSTLSIIVIFLFLFPLLEGFKKIKNGTFSMWNKISLILRAMISTIVGVFLYNFIFQDYSYWISNKIFLTQLAIFSLAFIILSYIINLIKTFREKRKNSHSTFNIIGTFLLILLNLCLITFPLLNSYSPKKELTLPVIKTPKSITINLVNKNEKEDTYSTKKTLEITDSKAILSICNAFSHSTIKNLINLDALKLSLTKMGENYYNLVPNYDSSHVNMYALENLKSGYLIRMEMLQDGETTLVVFNQDFNETSEFNPFKHTKFVETYKTKLSKETVDYIKSKLNYLLLIN